jgi:hypothetical protein
MSKGKGFLGSIMSELMDDDGKGDDKSKAAPAQASAPAPAPIIAPTMPYTFGTTAAGATAPGPGIMMPEPLDEKAVAAVNDGVYGGSESHYVHFVKVWQTLGSPVDPTIALKTMQAMDPNITAQAILTDINGHLARLDKVAADAEGAFQAAAQERLGSADQTLAQLQSDNEKAAAEITRHQQETADRIAQITQVTQQRATDEGAIAAAKRKTEAAEAAVKQQLMNMQTLFSRLPA